MYQVIHTLCIRILCTFHTVLYTIGFSCVIHELLSCTSSDSAFSEITSMWEVVYLSIQISSAVMQRGHLPSHTVEQDMA